MRHSGLLTVIILNHISNIYEVCVTRAHRQIPGSNLCLLHAIANAHALLLGMDITRIEWDQSKMRDHWEKCIKQGKLELFPHKLNAVGRLGTGKSSLI